MARLKEWGTNKMALNTVYTTNNKIRAILKKAYEHGANDMWEGHFTIWMEKQLIEMRKRSDKTKSKWNSGSQS